MKLIANTITELMFDTVNTGLQARADACAAFDSKVMVFTDCDFRAHCCDYELDVTKDLWFTKGRWSKLVKEYVDRIHLEKFIHQSIEIHRGRAGMGASTGVLFKEQGGINGRHWWGGCLQGMTFTRVKSGSVLTLNSRTSYLGYMAMLDVGIAHLVAKRVDSQAPIAFRWNVSAAQIELTRLLPYVLNTPVLRERLESERRRYKINLKLGKLDNPTGWHNLAKLYRDFHLKFKKHGPDMVKREKHGPTRQIKKKWLVNEGLIKEGRKSHSYRIGELDFSRAG